MRLGPLIWCLAVISSVASAEEFIDPGTPSDAGVTAVTEPSPPPSAPEAPAPKIELGAKFGEGVTVRSGEFSLNLRGRMQLQATVLVPTPGSDAVRSNQFVVRRARLILKGDLPWHLSWVMHLGFSANDLEADAPNPIRDLYVQWNGWRDLSLRVGQMKVPFDVQRVVSSSSLQLVDRSLATLELNLDRDIGFLLFSDDLFGWGKRLKYAVGIWQGDGRNRIGTNIGLLYTARVSFHPFGGLDEKVEGDIERSSKFRLAIGGGIARNNETPRPRSTYGTPYKLPGGFDYTHGTGDVHVKWHGFSLLAEVYVRQADTDSRTGVVNGATLTEYSRSGWGWFAQAGMFATPWLEFAARYGDLQPFAGTDPTFVRNREIGGGANVFFMKHDLKLMADYFWLDDGRGGNGRHQVRVLAQLYF